MRRDRVAVVGTRGLFASSVAAALESDCALSVRGFSLDDERTSTEGIETFKPDVVVLVRSEEQPVPQTLLRQNERGVPIVALDITEPTLSFTYKDHVSPVTLGGVLDAVRAMLTSKKTSEKIRRGEFVR